MLRAWHGACSICSEMKEASTEDTIMTTPSQSTLLDLVQAVNAYAASEEEVVATVASRGGEGRVFTFTFRSNIAP